MMADSETSWSKFAFETQARELQETRARIEDGHSRIATLDERLDTISERQVRMEERYKHTATHGDLANLKTDMVKQIAESAASQTKSMKALISEVEEKRLESTKLQNTKLDALKQSIDEDKSEQKKLRENVLRFGFIGLLIILSLLRVGGVDWAAFAL